MKTISLSLFIIALLAVSEPAAALSCNRENTAVVATTPTSDFILQNNGTVTHRATGLMWMRCSLGQAWDGTDCTGSASVYDWQTALEQAEESTFSGYSDWRMPNKNELASILELRCWSPAINAEVFPNTPNDWFWSSSPHNYSSYAWYVDFVNFKTGSQGKHKTIKARLVRGGQTFVHANHPESINIIGTWNYILTYDDCPNQTEQGTSTWTYHSDGYALSTYTSNQIDPRYCSYIGPDDSDDGGNHYPASNPITPAEFESGLNDYNSNYLWDNTQFKTKNKISLTGTIINTYSATLIFTR
jgi:hypothetical protein